MQDKQNQSEVQPPSLPSASSQPVSSPEDKGLLAKAIGRRPQRQRTVFLSELVEERAHLVVRLVGYGLLVFGLFDYIHIVIPLRFTDPIWEFQIIGALVERVAAPLIGLAMVFYRPQGYIRELERKLLGCLSWISLLLGVLYLLMLPLGITDAWRIYNANTATISAQVFQQTQPLYQLKVKLNQAKTDEQLQKLFASLTPRRRIPQIEKPQEIKEQLLTKISQAQRNMKVQADTVGGTQRQALLKNAVKWSLCTLVAGTLFILIWHLTDWARMGQY